MRHYPRSMTARVLVSLDGDVRDPEAPILHADDLGGVRGDGAFETVLLRGGTPCRLQAHLDRLTASARMLDLPEPDHRQWSTAVATAIGEWPSDDEGAIRLFLSRGREGGDGGVTAFVSIASVPDRVHRARAEGVSATVLPRGFSITLAESAPWQLLGAKTLSYATNMAALRHARENGFDDVVFRSTEGFVLEGPRSTVVAVTGQTMVTPPTEHGVLRGTTVDALFDAARGEGWDCSHAPLRVADLLLADSVWLVSSVTLAAKVQRLDATHYRASDVDNDIRALVDAAITV